jgi:hypothetical protein
MSSSDLRTVFIDSLKLAYGVDENLGRYLFERWNIKKKLSRSEIQSFVLSDEVKMVFIVAPGVNRAKRYTRDEIRSLGAELSQTVDANKRIFKDDKFGFTWQEAYNGLADSYTGLFDLIEPEPEDQHLI